MRRITIIVEEGIINTTLEWGELYTLYVDEKEVKVDESLENKIKELKELIEQHQRGERVKTYEKKAKWTQMDIVGWLGFRERGRDIYLYQCPVCKRVAMNADDLYCNHEGDFRTEGDF